MLQRLMLMVCLLLPVAATAQRLPEPPRPDFTALPRAEIIRTVDGDTVALRMDGQEVRCRLRGVDTPELSGDPARTFYGREAAWFTYNLLAGEEVWVEVDPERPRDRYDRLLAMLYRVPDGLPVNLELVRQGYARVYTREKFALMELFKIYEQRASEARKGLWNPNLASQATAETGTAERAAGAGAEQPDAQRAMVPVAAGKGGPTVYVTDSGTRYHRADCRSLSRSRNPLALEVAHARGLEPCSVCKPGS